MTVVDARTYTNAFVAMNADGEGKTYFGDVRVRRALVQAWLGGHGSGGNSSTGAPPKISSWKLSDLVALERSPSKTLMCAAWSSLISKNAASSGTRVDYDAVLTMK